MMSSEIRKKRGAGSSSFKNWSVGGCQRLTSTFLHYPLLAVEGERGGKERLGKLDGETHGEENRRGRLDEFRESGKVCRVTRETYTC